METTNIEYLREMKMKSGADGRWNHFKIPFGLLIIAILGFLSMVEEGLFARISTLIASIGFILPGLIEVVSSWPKLWPGRKG